MGKWVTRNIAYQVVSFWVDILEGKYQHVKTKLVSRQQSYDGAEPQKNDGTWWLHLVQQLRLLQYSG